MISRFRLLLDKYPYYFTFLSCFLFLFLRASGRFLYAHLWAEDGSLFLPDAITYGWKSIFLPYAGYYHTLPRIIAYITHFFDASTYPLIIVISTSIIFISVIQLLISENYSYLVKERYHRFLICLSLCMAPGLHEVLGNLANLHWILFLYISLSTLNDSNTKLKLSEGLFLLVAIFSTGETIVLIPILLLQLILQYRKNRIVSSRTAFLFVLISISVILNLLQKEKLPQGPSFDLITILRGWYSSVINTMILQPLIGDKYVIKLFKKYWYIYEFGSPLIGLFLVFRIAKQKRVQLYYFVLLVILIAFLPFLAFIVRPYAMGVYANVHIVWNFRYAFILAPWGLLLYAATISTISSDKVKNYMFFTFFILYLFLNRYRFFIPAYGKEDWKSQAPIIEEAIRTGCPNHVSVPIYPDGTDGLNVRFYFKLDLPEPQIPCP
jgi:hypothetical protein